MAYKGTRVGHPAALGGGGDEDFALAVTCGQLALVAGTPVDRVALTAVVLQLEDRRSRACLASGGLTGLQSGQLGSDVVDADDALVGPDTDDLRTARKTLG